MKRFEFSTQARWSLVGHFPEMLNAFEDRTANGVASSTPPVKEVINEGESGLMFDFFDQNREGFISNKEYADFFAIFGLDDQHLQESFQKLSHSNKEKLNRYDLLSAMEDFFTSDDQTKSGNWIFGHWNSTPYGS